MNLWGRIMGWFGLRESQYPSIAGGAIDPDEHLYRSLTNRSVSDLPEYQHAKMLKVAGHLDRANPVARRILDLLIDFVFAEGVNIQANNDAVREVLEQHWDDPINRWDEHGPNIFRLLLRDGELVMPASVNPVDGRVRWGQIMSRQIKDVVPDIDDWRVTREIVLKSPPDQPDRTLAGINLNFETDRLEGEALLLRYGNVDGLRGISFLYPLADYLDYLDQASFSEIERLQLLRSFLWDVEIEGDASQVLEKMKDPAYGTPKPGSVRLHTSTEKWTAVTPSLGTYDAVNLIDFLLNTLILGSVGIPEHWFGSGGDVNRAVGSIMGQPTVKMLTRLQRMWTGYLTTMMQYVVDQAVEHRALVEVVEIQDADGNGTGEMVPAREAFQIAVPDMDTTDMQATSATLLSVTQSLVVAEDRGYVTQQTAGRVWASIASQFGPDVDPDYEAEQAAIEQEQADDEPSMPKEVVAQLDQELNRKVA